MPKLGILQDTLRSPQIFFLTMGRQFCALLELLLSDLRDFSVIRLRLDGPRELWSLRPLWSKTGVLRPPPQSWVKFGGTRKRS